MSNYDRTGRDPDTRSTMPRETRNSGPLIAGAIIALLAIVALGYAFGDRMMGTSMTEHRASVTDTVQPSVSPAPAPSPSVAPKP